MASSSSHLLFPRIYDVFLSFHGSDTRKTFISHLYAQLCEKGIVTFKDDRGLEYGDHISTELRRAIEGSKIAVVVLSKNYTSSKWCLMELAFVMESYKLDTLKVFPIFYGVDPSDVRKQKGSFSLKQYQKNKLTRDKVPKWRKALSSIADLSGKDSRNCLNEYKMVKGIVEDISRQLDLMQATSFDDVVCMEAHIEQMRRLLDIESEGEARMVGIWGMGGIGKTTIAKYLYEKFSRLFHAQCFMENIDKRYKKFDRKGLQKQFLGDILRSKRVALKDELHGATLIQSRLKNLKVFVVLDGVDKVEQVDALAKQATWFGKGSRIIITTRDRRLLESVGVVNRYNVKCLGSEDSLKMFKHFAFRGGVSRFDERLAIRASQLAHGLPFALEALGKYFRGTASITQWKADITTFETNPHQNIMDVLRSSYTNLEPITKLTFLRIACLFNGEPVSRVSAILGTSIEDLADKSLIHISNDRCINMHSLIQQMGREIVIENSKSKPQKQAILWDPLNSYGVLQRNTGTINIEGMALHMCELSNGSLPINESAFNQMHNLKFLKLFKHRDVTESTLELTSGNCITFPLNLRLLHWDAYPLRTLPPKFPLDCLVELHLRHSNLERLWDGSPFLKMLKILDVTGSKDLIKLPDLSSAPELEELIMKGCTKLTKILETTDKLTTLRKLDASHCDGLMKLEMTIREFPRLENNNYWAFQQHVAKTSSDVVVAKTDSLKNLSIQCKLNFRLKHLEGKADHFSFSSKYQRNSALTMSKTQTKYDLYSTAFYGCESLDIMEFNYNKDGASFKIISFSKFSSLTELNLINLKMHNIPNDIGGLSLLQKLDLSGNDFPHLPNDMENLSKLKSLRLCNCNILLDLPQLTQLETLTLSDCINLRWFPHTRNYLLQKLWLDNCKNVQDLSDTLSHCTNLTYLDLSRSGFVTMPESITLLPLLRTLCLNDCNNLKSLTELPLSLKYLYAHGCKSLETFSISINHSFSQIDLIPSWDGKKNSSQTTWFPAARSNEALLCDEESHINLPEGFKPFILWVYVIYFMVVGVEFILHMTDIVKYSARTSIIAHACLNSLIIGISWYMRL